MPPLTRVIFVEFLVAASSAQSGRIAAYSIVKFAIGKTDRNIDFNIHIFICLHCVDNRIFHIFLYERDLVLGDDAWVFALPYSVPSSDSVKLIVNCA